MQIKVGLEFLYWYRRDQEEQESDTILRGQGISQLRTMGQCTHPAFLLWHLNSTLLIVSLVRVDFKVLFSEYFVQEYNVLRPHPLMHTSTIPPGPPIPHIAGDCGITTPRAGYIGSWHADVKGMGRQFLAK